jgi:hypothetical protein
MPFSALSAFSAVGIFPVGSQSTLSQSPMTWKPEKLSVSYGHDLGMGSAAALLLVTELYGQANAPLPPLDPGPRLPIRVIRGAACGPQELIRTMLAAERTRRGLPGATVEVIGYDEEATLKLLSLKVAAMVQFEFRPMDKLQHQELRALMQQDPSKPVHVLFVPRLPGP